MQKIRDDIAGDPSLSESQRDDLLQKLNDRLVNLTALKAQVGNLTENSTPEQFHDVVQQVQHLIQTGIPDLASITGSNAESVRQTIGALQTHHAGALARGVVDTDHIEIAFLVGNAAFNKYLLAVSVSAVFFGANTYIGNGPNFMVKSIADHQKVHTPGFLGFIFKYTLPCMLPMLLLLGVCGSLHVCVCVCVLRLSSLGLLRFFQLFQQRKGRQPLSKIQVRSGEGRCL